ncbi:YggS family pyridoxal phosphate-dependent enzyme [Cellulomonas sp. HZM]|uniref:YggS family pyridoxal phosphate-dependent enzyme n=1 Tax=Cellulomonas sp. HZM TaxID=1454010 RepID=UPI0004938937|nr:YggS family pyridoxal phosphate-dependent enzyme [Cellulomonas sp. HZM]
MDDELDDRLAAVRARVARACSDAGRDPGAVRVLLATKTQDASTIRAALEADARACAADPTLRPVLVGENRVQELVAKAPLLADVTGGIHLIGQLQANKVNAALRWSSCIESVDSIALARRLAERTEGLDVLVQVNVSGEPTKSGTSPEGALPLLEEVAGLGTLCVRGLMTIGLRSDESAAVRAGFDTLRRLRDAGAARGLCGPELSMGMSGDLDLAVAAGATVVRVGTAVFGARRV